MLPDFHGSLCQGQDNEMALTLKWDRRPGLDYLLNEKNYKKNAFICGRVHRGELNKGCAEN